MGHIGILGHGRHLETKEWERLVWGEPPEKLGTLPRIVLEILNQGPEWIGAIVIGTGASADERGKEAEVMKHYLFDHKEGLEEFRIIKEHPIYQTRGSREELTRLLEEIVPETTSQNTAQEIEAASRIFQDRGCENVYQISSASHIARAGLEASKARASGLIPDRQTWYQVADDMPYPGTEIDDVVVIEPPHRGDDPRINEDVKMHEVVPLLFKASSEARVEALYDLKRRLES